MQDKRDPGPDKSEWGEPGSWQYECLKFYGRVLLGVQGHWCVDWDGLPIDETCGEYHLGDVPEDKNVPCKACGYFDDEEIWCDTPYD